MWFIHEQACHMICAQAAATACSCCISLGKYVRFIYLLKTTLLAFRWACQTGSTANAHMRGGPASTLSQHMLHWAVNYSCCMLSHWRALMETLLELGNGLARVEALGACLGAIHDRLRHACTSVPCGVSSVAMPRCCARHVLHCVAAIVLSALAERDR